MAACLKRGWAGGGGTFIASASATARFLRPGSIIFGLPARHSCIGRRQPEAAAQDRAKRAHVVVCLRNAESANDLRPDDQSTEETLRLVKENMAM